LSNPFFRCLEALAEGTKSEEAYGQTEISERHRHRYELNNSYREMLTEHGLVLAGTSPDQRLVEVVEIPDHPWFVSVQFHPELKSRPIYPHPLFRDFVAAAVSFHEGDSGRDQQSQLSETDLSKIDS